jgi:beta-phosphoglucomutase-like phosphatase (HAD superfamily)
MNRFLASLGVQVEYTAESLLAMATGKTFRMTAVDLATRHGVAVDSAPASGSARGQALTAAALDGWVAEELDAVTTHLAQVLRPDDAVLGPVRRLAARFPLAAVSSSALSRLDASFRAAGLAELLPPERRYSAEDSLATPTSKPDPAVYLHAAEQLGVAPREALAVEDSVAGAQSAVAAGIPTIGNVMFVPSFERDGRRAALLAAGATTTVDSWEQIARMLTG